MSNLDELETRIFAALGRIRAVVDDSADLGGTAKPLLEKLKSFDSENARLNDEVQSLRDKREQDVKELDTLLTELKPLIQEGVLMPGVDLKIGGRNYLVACQDGEEAHLQSAAKALNKEADQVVSASGGRLPESRVLLMAGLMLADRIAETSNAERYADERIEGLEAKLREAEKANAELKVKLADVESRPTPVADNASSDAAVILLEQVARELEEVADQMDGPSAA